tara:strand:- start:261 stop:404 length:144 start_codon:yes stop_codon:yes gene_type:complete
MTDIIVETEASLEEVTKALNDAGIKAFIYRRGIGWHREAESQASSEK